MLKTINLKRFFGFQIIRSFTVIVLFVFAVLDSPGFASPQPNSEDQKSGSSFSDTLSLEDLGFSKEDIQADPQFQKELETRSDMLRIHQTLGLITAVPMTAEFVLGLATAGNVSRGSTDTTLHTSLGLATVALYGTTALFEILAPKPKGMKPSGNTEVHEALSWIHLPLIVVVPLVGDMINDRIANNQPIGNLGVVHGAMATTLLASYLASLTVMTF
jgi:hypothetical protein